MKTERPNRKQRAASARLRNEMLNLDSFVTADWNIEDWQKLPRPSEGWTAKPDLKRFLIVRVKAIHFSDGVTRRFYQVIARPETRREWKQLHERAKDLLAECRQEITSAIVRNERKFIKQPYRRKRRGRKER